MVYRQSPRCYRRRCRFALRSPVLGCASLEPSPLPPCSVPWDWDSGACDPDERWRRTAGRRGGVAKSAELEYAPPSESRPSASAAVLSSERAASDSAPARGAADLKYRDRVGVEGGALPALAGAELAGVELAGCGRLVLAAAFFFALAAALVFAAFTCFVARFTSARFGAALAFAPARCLALATAVLLFVARFRFAPALAAAVFLVVGDFRFFFFPPLPNTFSANKPDSSPPSPVGMCR